MSATRLFITSFSCKVIRRNEDTSEDCLHLNVWTPCTEETRPGCRKTVLVFFHGQEFQWGDNNYYDGQWLAGLGQVVVVAPNFRLGAFGFLHIGCPGNVSESNIEGVACAPGNVALDDQRLAVEWIVAHIRSFGGNSTDIVLLGSGSGAWSVGAHMLGATARGPSDQFWKHERFTKVILMSESPLRRRLPARSQALSLRLGCPPEDLAEQLKCLRNKPARAILEQTNQAKDFLFPSLVPTSAEADNVSGTPKGGDLAEDVANWLNTRYGIAVSHHVIEAYRTASVALDGGILLLSVYYLLLR
ncbi:hypothetical protein HPB48_006154 [Haemaphysalis longicornis]|uniref:Carboxylesterase type B domain-containing protein n=1 Tax=Haemaphysalis longicornis TaxID=44386 RepID=A0A9J6GZY9_HAELO|nr:hypothetical protein HPB48_006154 [Haemaphysalis longicornis]